MRNLVYLAIDHHEYCVYVLIFFDKETIPSDSILFNQENWKNNNGAKKRSGVACNKIRTAAAEDDIIWVV